MFLWILATVSIFSPTATLCYCYGVFSPEELRRDPRFWRVYVRFWRFQRVQVRFRKVPVQTLRQVPEGSTTAEFTSGAGGFWCRGSGAGFRSVSGRFRASSERFRFAVPCCPLKCDSISLPSAPVMQGRQCWS